MSAFYNHAIQGGAIHALPFIFFNEDVQGIAFISGAIIGVYPDVIKSVNPTMGEILHHSDKWYSKIPAWFVHTKLIDDLYHKTYKPGGWFLNWFEVYMTVISIFILLKTNYLSIIWHWIF